MLSLRIASKLNEVTLGSGHAVVPPAAATMVVPTLGSGLSGQPRADPRSPGQHTTNHCCCCVCVGCRAQHHTLCFFLLHTTVFCCCVPLETARIRSRNGVCFGERVLGCCCCVETTTAVVLSRTQTDTPLPSLPHLSIGPIDSLPLLCCVSSSTSQ